MILRTDKRTYLIFGAVFALVMTISRSITFNGFGIIGTLAFTVICWAFYSGVMLFLAKHQENKAYYCRHKVETAQEVICQGSAAIRKSGFNSNSGWLFLGNASLDFYKISAASGEKVIEINLSDIVSTSVKGNVLTINTDVQKFAFGVGQAKEWKKQIEQAAQRANLTQTTPKNNADNTQELIKFKQLLDSGVISQEEFDAKKKQLLGL